MMDFGLNDSIAEFRAIRIDDRLSDDAVTALIRLHQSVAGLPASDYGHGEVHRDALAQLFAICSRRCRSNQSLVRRSRMIPVLYQALYLPDEALDERKYDRCLNGTFALADAWRERCAAGRISDEQARVVEYGVLRSIGEAFADVVVEDKASDRDFRAMQRRIAEWTAAFNPDGSGDGLSDYDALRRLDILTAYANLHADGRLERLIGQSVNHYYGRISEAAQTDARTLHALYRVVVQATEPEEDAKADALAERAVRQAALTPRGGDERLWLLAVCVDRACANIRRESKQLLLGHSA